MRFVRAYVHSDTGELVNITEQEAPFDKVHVSVSDDVPFTLEVHDLGMAEDFVPSHPETGEPCSPAYHLYGRMECAPDKSFKAKAGHELPNIIACPITVEGLRTFVAKNGPKALHPKVRAWVSHIAPHHALALGIDKGIPISVHKALDDMRTRRDPAVGSRRFIFERLAQQSSDSDAALRLAKRQKGKS